LRGATAAEHLAAADGILGTTELGARLAEWARLETLTGLRFGLDSKEGVTFADTLPAVVLRLASLRDQLGVSAQTALRLEIAARLLEGLTALEVAGAVHGLSAAETATLADRLTRALWSTLAPREALALSDATERSFTMVFAADEALGLADAAVNLVELLLRTTETLAFLGRMPLEDGDYEGWVMNSDSLGVTQYGNVPFVALATHAERTLGLTETGLYVLEGDTDDGEPIAAMLRTGDLTFGTGQRKSVPRAYLYLRQDGDMILKTISSERGRRSEFWYRVVLRDGDDPGARRVRLGRGVRAVSWAFELVNVDGADFDLRGCEVLPVALSRRV
jgi:hypothetical protein